MNGKTLRSTVYLVVFGVITVALTYVLALTIQNGSVGNTRTYRAVFSDATGLLTGDDVRISGVRVGQIRTVKLLHPRPGAATGRDPDAVCAAGQPSCALVTFGLARSIPVSSTAMAVLRYRNLVGQRYLELDQDPSNVTPLAGSAGHPPTLPEAQTRPALDLTVLFDGFRPLFQALDPTQVNQVAFEIVSTLQGQGGTIDALLSSTASLSSTLAAQDSAIGSLVTNLSTVLTTVNNRDSDLANLIDQLQRLVTGLAGDRASLTSSLTGVNNLALSTTRLLETIRPTLPGNLTNLATLTNTLNTSTITVNGVTSNTVDEFLRRLPTKLNKIIRTATYKSYFNFYLCDADIALGGGQDLKLHSTNALVCGSGAS